MKLLLAIALLLSCSASAIISPMTDTHGVPNLDQVEGNIWRSGQITTQAGWDYIGQLAAGRKVHILKLNYTNEGSDAAGVALGFEVLDFAVQPEGDQDAWDDLLSAFKGPDPKVIAAAIAELSYCKAHAATDFCLGHCTHGQDRTGYLFGVYRVLIDGWTKAKAYEEMIGHHFHPELHGVHEAWESFTPISVKP